MYIDEDSGDVLGEGSTFIFKDVLCVAGALHIFSNASKQLYNRVQCWEGLYKALKTLELLFSNPSRFRLFVNRLVATSEHSTSHFRSRAPHLYDKRWGEVWKFCCWLSERADVIRAVWNEATYLPRDQPCPEGVHDDDDGFHSLRSPVCSMTMLSSHISTW